jgi:hypothetical protein
LATALVKRYAADVVELSDAEDVWQILRLARELKSDVGLGQHRRLGAAALTMLKQREGAYPRAVPPKNGLRSVGRRCATDSSGEQPQRISRNAASAETSIVVDVEEYRVGAGRHATRVSRKGDVRAQVASCRSSWIK